MEKDTLFFIDIDGTISDRNHVINDEIIKILKFEKKIKFILSTGRNSNYVKKLDLGLDAICSNGGEILYKNGETKKISSLDLNSIIEIIKICKNNNLLCSLSTEFGNVMEINSPVIETLVSLSYLHHSDPTLVVEGINAYYNIIYKNAIKVEDSLKFLKENSLSVNKIEIYSSLEKTNLRKRFSTIENIEIFSSHMSNLEIIPKDVSKKNGIAQYLENKLDNFLIFSIGDGGNDIDMFSISDFSFAMDNADDMVKDHCNKVVGSVENDGFIDAYNYILKHYFENRVTE